MQGWVIGPGKWFQLGFTFIGYKFTVTACYPIGMMASTMSCVVLFSPDCNRSLPQFQGYSLSDGCLKD